MTADLRYRISSDADTPMITLSRNPDPRTLRWFAVSQITLALIVVWMTRSLLSLPVLLALISVSIGLAIIGWLRPQMIRSVYMVWTFLFFPVGWIVTHLVLGAFYFGVLTPIALVLRWRRGDPLQRQIDPTAETYWIPHRDPESQERYLRQY